VRLAPVPESTASIIVSGDLDAASAFLEALAATALLPAAVSLTNAGGEDETWRVAVWCDGLEQDVTRHLRDLEALARRMDAPVETLRDGAHRAHWDKICSSPLAHERCVYRMIVPRACLRSTIDAVAALGAPAPLIIAGAVTGTIWLSWPAEKAFVTRLPRLISIATAHRGHAVLFAAPERLKENIDVWGPPPASLGIMQRIKQQFDPGGVLNPDIFLGGL
jgi:glycolate oxidase FAD binding subunit